MSNLSPHTVNPKNSDHTIHNSRHNNGEVAEYGAVSNDVYDYLTTFTAGEIFAFSLIFIGIVTGIVLLGKYTYKEYRRKLSETDTFLMTSHDKEIVIPGRKNRKDISILQRFYKKIEKSRDEG